MGLKGGAAQPINTLSMYTPLLSLFIFNFNNIINGQNWVKGGAMRPITTLSVYTPLLSLLIVQL